MPDTPHDAPPAGRGHREGTKVELRRLDAVHLYLRGHYKAEIGRRLGVDRRTVRRDIDAVRAEWKAERITVSQRGAASAGSDHDKPPVHLRFVPTRGG